MPVKVRIVLKSMLGGREVHSTALVNTGFTSEAPDIAVPPSVAEKLGLWPLPEGAILASVETGGGVVEAYIIPRAVSVRVVTSDRTSREVVANVLINPYLSEILISDYLAEELGIQILYPRRGLWKFVDEDKIRESIA